ncbi:hypothetical protein RRG08_002461 [Elysia crispata]|uniref:Uncharacterized protein n=1 Tax=Elysia crispata TaxID=231223 RepID=A0AAE1A7P4_9GAST|nr:hypothetical protein RRG08_002461 [Elysia crispata]
MAGLVLAPLCGMILADFGATVIRIDKSAVSSMAGNCNIHFDNTASPNTKRLKADFEEFELEHRVWEPTQKAGHALWSLISAVHV